MSDVLTTPWVLPCLVLAALAVVLVLTVVVLRRQARTRAELAAARADAAELRAQVAAVERREAERDRAAGDVARSEVAPAARRRPAPDYVITRLGAEPAAPVAPAGPRRTVEVAGRVDGRLFADLVLRETLVRAAAVTYGVRRALAPETRNRVRFEVRREVKRSRRARRAELKQARRDLHARQRAEEAA
ncbi:hypothetical protein INN71_07450 [Nocardioides sp. ChNu-153]|uniref:hypothetical protein n=1 Tax=unclassified Nocardioides TaxID=2615069 RepID=UPI0024065107|nr:MULTISPECIES: hypothetical protein [unclassified Nocardioides]MDF9717681.1 hypothetical protein [Nocardioides sp. ChNu-99]MDN7121225.1 hypothetical protein [Nocardioides sp. ChNu-153]